MAEKRLAGWRFGTVRDDTKRCTPLLVDYAQLSEAEREKDRQAVLGIASLLSVLAMKPVRVS